MKGTSQFMKLLEKATLYNMNKIRRNIFFSAHQYALVNWRPFSGSRFLFLPSVCSCSAITVLHSASVAVIHVITTLFLWQPESVVECWQLSKIKSPLVNLHLVQRARVGAWSSDKRGRRRQRGVTHWVEGLDTPLPPAWHHRWLCLPRCLFPGYLRAPPAERNVCHVMCSALQDHKNRMISR